MSTTQEPTAPVSTSLVTRSSREHEIQSRIVDLCAQAKRCVVTDDDSAERATSLAVAIKTNIKSLEEDRLRLTGPLNGVIKDINSRYKAMASPAEPALEYLTGKNGQLTKWNVKKKREAEEAAIREKERIERERLEDARRAEEEAARLRAEGDAEGAEIASQQAAEALDAAVEVPTAVEAPSTITRGIVGGSSGLASVGKFRVFDFGMLLADELRHIRAGGQPRYVMVDESVLGKIARRPENVEKPMIPGVEFYREETTRVRG